MRRIKEDGWRDMEDRRRSGKIWYKSSITFYLKKCE